MLAQPDSSLSALHENPFLSYGENATRLEVGRSVDHRPSAPDLHIPTANHAMRSDIRSGQGANEVMD